MSDGWAGLMRQALRQAVRGYGRTGPNPLVGALVVRDGEVISSGYHVQVGKAHAEVMALDRAGAAAAGADLVVTLEPCSHFGRTPPCVGRVVQAGVKRVVVGCLDPNPRERGRGVAKLREAGLDVLVGVEEERCRRLNDAYFKFITTGIPFVTLKLAMSLDGRIATGSGDARWISGSETARFVHGLRRECNAILVGGETVRGDDPSLTVRLVRPDTKPLRVVVSSGRDLAPAARVFQDQERWPTVLFCGPLLPDALRRQLESQGVRVERIGPPAAASEGDGGSVGSGSGAEPGEEGDVDLADVLVRLGRMGVSRLLVEGGGKLGGAMLTSGLVDRFVAIHAPLVIGSSGRSSVAAELPDVLSTLPRYEVEWMRRMGTDCVVSVRTRKS